MLSDTSIRARISPNVVRCVSKFHPAKAPTPLKSTPHGSRGKEDVLLLFGLSTAIGCLEREYLVNFPSARRIVGSRVVEYRSANGII